MEIRLFLVELGVLKKLCDYFRLFFVRVCYLLNLGVVKFFV